MPARAWDGAAFAARVRDERERADLSYPELVAAVQKITGKAKGSSHGTIWSYANDPPDEPRWNIIEALAEVFGVRNGYLAHGEGPRTEEEEEARQGASAMTRASMMGMGVSYRVDGLFQRTGGPSVDEVQVEALVADALGPVLNPIRKTLDLTRIDTTPSWSSGVIEVWRRLVTAGGREGNTARIIANALRAPMDAMGVDPDEMDQRGDLALYIGAMVPALMILADEKRRQRRDIQKKEG